MKHLFLYFAWALLLAVTGCSDNDDRVEIVNPSPKEQWGKTLVGGDGTIFAYPDLYVNYWEYTWSTEDHPDLALRIKGAFPKARFFSFSLYDDEKGEAIGGFADNEIVPDDGSVNPFVVTSPDQGSFTVYIAPSAMDDSQVRRLDSPNVCRVKEGVKRATIVVREYLGVDEYGGVELPSIEAVDIHTMEEVAAPIRMNSNVTSFDVSYSHLWSDERDEMPFFLATRGAYYPNNSTDYLFARTILKDDQVLVFSFVPVTIPKTVEEYKTAHARYWSICFGSARDTHSYYSVYDEQAAVPDGEACTFVVCMKQNHELEAVRNKVEAKKAKVGHWQLVVWDRERKSVEGNAIGDCIVTMYRNILPDKSWEYSISSMIPTPYGDPVNTAQENPDKMIARRALGKYGPHGWKYTTAEFLADQWTERNE